MMIMGWSSYRALHCFVWQFAINNSNYTGMQWVLDDGGTLGVEYASGADRVFVWDSSGVGARTDYNGVLLLRTALQRPLPSSQPDKIIRIELVLSEVSSFPISLWSILLLKTNYMYIRYTCIIPIPWLYWTLKCVISCYAITYAYIC